MTAAHNPFLHLGHDRGDFYYLCVRSGQVLMLRAEQHVEGRLIALASRQWWEINYPCKTGADWRAVQNAMISRSYEMGIYDPARIRGRGAWWDMDHAVVHAGDKLIVHGKEQPINTPGRYIYERGLPYPIKADNPLDAKSAYELIKICNLFSWEKPINAYYLAGWIALAIVGGALEWRPHVWITGSASSGKSTAMRFVVKRILEGIAICNQSSTTEAAIRGKFSNGALPVLLDEMESKTKVQKQRVDAMIDLARASSTQGGDPISKARPDGSTRDVFVRSVFIFSSISYPLTKPEDIRRITPLSIIKDGNKERFDRLKIAIAENLTDEFCARFCARSIAMIPVIRQGARVFGNLLATKFKSQSLGDQYGALLAGAWTLFQDRAPTTEEASKWIEKQHAVGAWQEQQAAEIETDERQLIDHILSHVVRVQGKAGMIERSIAHLLEIAGERADIDPLPIEAAREILALRGMMATESGPVFSTTHTAIAEILKDTAWSRNWGRTLKRLPGAEITAGPVSFGSTRSRGVSLPWWSDPTPPPPQPDLLKADPVAT